MRLIDADNLSGLKFAGNKFVQIGGRSNGKTLEAINRAYQQGWNDAIDVIINDIPTVERPQGEWILISERLPDYLEDTLVTIQINNREPKVRSGFYANGCFHNDNGDVWNWNDPEIKAWMPLPKAYKEDN